MAYLLPGRRPRQKGHAVNRPSAKYNYVRQQGQTRGHTCHWPGCDKQVPPAMWGCKNHWFRLPPALRSAIWDAYVPGQEVTITPSAAYLEAARKVEAWIGQQGPPAPVPVGPEI